MGRARDSQFAQFVGQGGFIAVLRPDKCAVEAQPLDGPEGTGFGLGPHELHEALVDQSDTGPLQKSQGKTGILGTCLAEGEQRGRTAQGHDDGLGSYGKLPSVGCMVEQGSVYALAVRIGQQVANHKPGEEFAAQEVTLSAKR